MKTLINGKINYWHTALIILMITVAVAAATWPKKPMEVKVNPDHTIITK